VSKSAQKQIDYAGKSRKKSKKKRNIHQKIVFLIKSTAKIASNAIKIWQKRAHAPKFFDFHKT
jgi:hypothetical protein